MPLLAQTFNNFGGLRLDAAIDEVGPDQAIDLLDVDWQGADGTLRNRDGATKFTKADAKSEYRSLWRHSDDLLLALRDRNVVAINPGAGIASQLVPPETEELLVENFTSASYAAMGTPNASYTYFAIYALKAPPVAIGVWRFDGTTWTALKGTVDGVVGKSVPIARYLATWPDTGNRMVYAGTESGSRGPGGATSSASHVWFSEPGDAESFESTAYVPLSPGDGEEITGAATWGGQVFIPKRSKLFVFYGADTDEEGKPEFLYRSINLPSPHFGGGSNGGQRMVAGNDGVYLLCADGVYLTTGSTPIRISDSLAPLASPRPIQGPAADTLGALRWNDFDQLYFFNDRLYLLSESIMVVYDIRRDAWLLWTTSATSLAPWNAGSGGPDDLCFSSGKNVYRFDTESDEDPTVELDPRWQSGFYDLGSDEEKALTQARLWGSGEVSVATAKDFREVGNSKTFALAAAPAIGSAQHQRTQHGVLHSHQFSGQGPWSAQRFVRYLEADRVPDTQAK
jgi:hypothetical protein